MIGVRKDMRHARVPLALFLLLIAACPGAARAAFGTPAQAAIGAQDHPVAVAFSKTGRGAIVVGRGFPPLEEPSTALVRFPSGKRTDLGGGQVVAQATRADGGVDLVVRRGKSLARRAELTLRRVFPDGRVYDLWSVTSTATTAEVVRASKRTIVIWPEGSALRFVSRADGGIPTHPRVARLGLSGTHSLAAVLDRDGRLVTAMTSLRGLVLASVSLNGTVRHRQSSPGVDGYVNLETDSFGRVAALIYDSGISVGDGECISEGREPKVRAAIRGADAQFFEPVRVLATPAFNCLGGNALLRTVNSRFFVVAYQAAGETEAGLVRQWVSAGRERFTGASDLVADADLADAIALRHSGSLLVAFTARPAGATRGQTALSVYTHPARMSQEIAPASANPRFASLALDPAGHPVLVWTEGAVLKVARDLGA